MVVKMKSAANMAKESFKNIKPCVHGADLLEAEEETGLKKEDILDFSSSVNPLGPSKKALKAVAESFDQIPSYPDSCATELRKAIASRFKGITAANVSVGNGSTELIYLFAEAFTRKGDVAVVPAPSFGEYEGAVRRTGCKIKYVRLRNGFQAEPEAFERAMIRQAKIVYFCNPNNPTSILTPPKVLNEIISNALKKDVLVFLDEDFLEFVENGEEYSMIGRIQEYPNLFILRSFTKIYGLTGLRMGYGVSSKEITDILMNAKIPWNVNCLAQSAAIVALKDEAHLEKTLSLIKQEKAYLLGELAKFKVLKVYPPEANFLFIDIRKTGLTAAKLRANMLQRGVLIRDCSSFAGIDEFYIRVAVKTRQENEKLLSALKASLG